MFIFVRGGQKKTFKIVCVNFYSNPIPSVAPGQKNEIRFLPDGVMVRLLREGGARSDACPSRSSARSNEENTSLGGVTQVR